MDGVATRAAGHVHQLIDAEVAFARRRRADSVGLVRKPDVQRFAVNFAEYRDRSNAQFTAGAEDPHGDFAAIGNQDFLEHRRVARKEFSMARKAS